MLCSKRFTRSNTKLWQLKRRREWPWLFNNMRKHKVDDPQHLDPNVYHWLKMMSGNGMEAMCCSEYFPTLVIQNSMGSIKETNKQDKSIDNLSVQGPTSQWTDHHHDTSMDQSERHESFFCVRERWRSPRLSHSSLACDPVATEW